MDTICLQDKCVRCGLNCELVHEHKWLAQKYSEKYIPSYATKDIENCFVYKYFEPISCGSKNVTEGIGNAFEIDVKYNVFSKKWEFISGGETKWKPERPVFISAQTGCGKNYFIENTLLPYIENLNLKKETDFKVLIISNRIALSLQTKDRLSKKRYHDSDNNDPIYHQYNKFRCAEVVNYQGLSKKLDSMRCIQQKTHSKYIFVVCDEAHFFTSDSTFNPYTGYILSEIVDIFKDAVRIYMTATPYECLPFIILYEHEIWRQFASKNYEHIEELLKDKVSFYSDKKGLFYHFKRDYSYLEIKCFSDYKELIEIIQNSGNEKWLVFRDNINAEKTFKESLDKAEGIDKETLRETGQANSDDIKYKHYAVDKSSKNDEKYQDIILGEALGKDTKVLITTCVLDNGVNFRNIKNVVISDIYRVKCLQMLGRARVDDKKQRITLYIQRLDEKFLKKRLEDFENQKRVYIEHNIFDDDHGYTFLNKYYGDGATDNDCNNFKEAANWFGWYKGDPCELHKNDIARSMVDLLVSICESIQKEMKIENEEDIVPGQEYMEYQYNWFGKEYKSETDTTFANKEEAKDALIAFLESHADGSMLLYTKDKDSDTYKFKEKFTLLYDEAFERNDKNHGVLYDISKINRLLEDHQLNYMLESDRKKIGENRGTYWSLVRFNREMTLHD